MIEGWRHSRDIDDMARHLLALIYHEQDPDGGPTMKARIGAMHLAEGLNNIRALKTAYTKPK